MFGLEGKPRITAGYVYGVASWGWAPGEARFRPLGSFRMLGFRRLALWPRVQEAWP